MRLIVAGESLDANVAMLSSVTMPSRDDGTGSAAIASCDPRIALFGAEMHLVLLAGLVERRHLVAGDEQAQRLRRVGHLHAEVGRFRAIEQHRHLGLAGIERGVDVDQAGNRPRLGEQRLAVLLELVEVGTLHHELDAAATAARPAAERHRGSYAGLHVLGQERGRGLRTSPRTDRGLRSSIGMEAHQDRRGIQRACRIAGHRREREIDFRNLADRRAKPIRRGRPSPRGSCPRAPATKCRTAIDRPRA